MAEHVERIGQRIRDQRKKLNLTQAELARRLPASVDGSQVSRWERGRHRPTDEHLEELAKALETTVATFMVDGNERGQTPDPLATVQDVDQEQLDRMEEEQREQRGILEELLRRTAPSAPAPSKQDTAPPPEEELGTERPPHTPGPDEEDTAEEETG